MFVIVYEFTVKKTHLDSFPPLWNKLTLLVKELSASRGARLHQASACSWIGYAEWPTRDSWENSNLNQEAVSQLRKQLSDSCDDIQIVYQLDVMDDLLTGG